MVILLIQCHSFGNSTQIDTVMWGDYEQWGDNEQYDVSRRYVNANGSRYNKVTNSLFFFYIGTKIMIQIGYIKTLICSVQLRICMTSQTV